MLGVRQAVVKYCNLTEELFIAKELPLTAHCVEELFHIVRDESAAPQSNRHKAESKTLTHWRNLLQKLQGIWINIVSLIDVGH